MTNWSNYFILQVVNLDRESMGQCWKGRTLFPEAGRDKKK